MVAGTKDEARCKLQSSLRACFVLKSTENSVENDLFESNFDRYTIEINRSESNRSEDERSSGAAVRENPELPEPGGWPQVNGRFTKLVREACVNRFGQSILNLKHLRLCSFNLNMENKTAFVQALSSFVQLEELGLNFFKK